jgi:methyl-accepting chemotaxis protein
MAQRRFSISTKVVLIAASFTAPIAVLLFLVVANINEFIAFAQHELQGDEYQRPLENALDSLARTQLLAQACAPGKSCAEQVAPAAAEMDKAIEQIAAIDGRLGQELQFTDEGLGKRDRSHVRIGNVSEEWKRLRAELSGAQPDAAAVAKAFDHLATDLRTMITHVGDTSNLILDPDLDSYYLMDVTLLALPQNQDRLTHVIAFGSDVLGHGTPKQDQRIALSVHAAMLQEADLDRILGSAQTSLNEDRNFYGSSPSLAANLKPALEAYKAAAANFIAMTRKLAESDAPGFDAAAYTSAGLAARNASFALWNVAVKEMDVLLGKRIDSYTSRRSWALFLSAMALVLSLVLSYVVKRSITRPLDRLAQSLGPGATLLSNSVERIAEASRASSTTPEEAVVICEELNAHADDMRKTVGELIAVVSGAGAASSPAAANSHQHAEPPGQRAA